MKKLILLSFLAVILALGGCAGGSSPTQPEGATLVASFDVVDGEGNDVSLSRVNDGWVTIRNRETEELIVKAPLCPEEGQMKTVIKCLPVDQSLDITATIDVSGVTNYNPWHHESNEWLSEGKNLFERKIFIN